MPDAWRAYLDLALGLTEAPRKKAQQVAGELLNRGGATAGQVQGLVEELLSAGIANREALTNIVRYEVDRALGRVGLATADEVSDLTSRVHELERRLREAQARAGTAEPGDAARPEKPAVVTPRSTEPPGVAETPSSPGSSRSAGSPVKKAVAKKAIAKKAVKAKPNAMPAAGTEPAGVLGNAAAVSAPAAPIEPEPSPAPVKRSPAKRAAAKQAPAKQAAAKQAPAKQAPAVEQAPGKRAPRKAAGGPAAEVAEASGVVAPGKRAPRKAAGGPAAEAGGAPRAVTPVFVEPAAVAPMAKQAVAKRAPAKKAVSKPSAAESPEVQRDVSADEGTGTLPGTEPRDVSAGQGTVKLPGAAPRKSAARKATPRKVTGTPAATATKTPRVPTQPKPATESVSRTENPEA